MQSGIMLSGICAENCVFIAKPSVIMLSVWASHFKLSYLKVHLHYGKDCAKLGVFKEQKRIVYIYFKNSWHDFCYSVNTVLGTHR
jgi:hypothetical protein